MIQTYVISLSSCIFNILFTKYSYLLLGVGVRVSVRVRIGYFGYSGISVRSIKLVRVFSNFGSGSDIFTSGLGSFGYI